LAVIDARTRLLPRRLVVPATLVVVAALVVEWVTTGDLEVLVRAAVGLVIASSSDPTVVDRLRRDVDALCVTPRHREVPGSLEAARAYCRERLEEVGWSVEERSFRPRPALR
jgi:hypothetical protein